MKASGTNRSHGKNLVNDLEHCLIASLSLLHIITSFVLAHRDANLGYDVSMAMVLERSGVASVFFLYAVVALVSDRTRVLPLPQEVLHLFAISAFGLEFIFFYLGEERENSLEGQYHHLMLVPIGVCVMTKILEIGYPKSILPSLAHSMALILQGTWFFQMAISLFSTPFIAMGCHLDQKGEGDYAIRCEGMSLMRGKAIATLQFNNHMAILLLFLLPLFAFMTKKGSVPSSYEPLSEYEGSVQERELVHLKGRVPEGAFVLEDDEEHSEDLTEVNGFHNGSV
ncbi:hypothetical protein O6H91_13G091800 [Diphasiastrum complanatum]|nr:hypothetical protein O6H91_13G091200 [Diphasiastrum complanatum]KAJ7534389.1 hypothetical protein O6H91_13G091800 [Diphasiastrum complanatum]